MIFNIKFKLLAKKEEAGGFRNLFLHTALALTITSGLSYFLGLIRDKSFAYKFGASSELDVYNAAFVVPDLFLAVLVTSALSAAFFSASDIRASRFSLAITRRAWPTGVP